jgi:hypothetical protein
VLHVTDRDISKYITSMPSHYSCMLGPALFKEIVVTQCLHASVWYNSLQPRSVSRIYGHDPVVLRGLHPVDRKFTEYPPVTQSELYAGYQRYRERAVAANSPSMLTRIKPAWTDVLKRLPNVDSFAIEHGHCAGMALLDRRRGLYAMLPG